MMGKGVGLKDDIIVLLDEWRIRILDKLAFLNIRLERTYLWVHALLCFEQVLSFLEVSLSLG